MPQRVLVWLRSDLRLHDQALFAQAQKADCLLPFVCLSPQLFAPQALGFSKTGPFRAQFLFESLADLRSQLRARGSDLCVAVGEPEVLIPEMVKKHRLTEVWTEAEATDEELREQAAVALNLPFSLRRLWGKTLYHLDDLPFPLAEMPHVFTQFRKMIEKQAIIRPCYATPETLPPFPEQEPGILPTLADFGWDSLLREPRAVLSFQGGERPGLKRIHHYIWETQCVKHYKETRNASLGPDYSSKFSPWLALGCVSPRFVYQEIQRFEQAFGANDSTYWLYFELLWRDYFRFVALRAGNRLFARGGLRGHLPPIHQDRDAFQRWCQGETSEAFVNAHMNELQLTGFMSNRGRQNVASYLCHDLHLDWRWGAAWFEHALIDYDVCSNWANWLYIAGVGNDPREHRYFNIAKQAARYDPKGDYTRYWTT